jgi:phosphoribosyl 1,2-cyclic phosphodiesterase
MRLTFCGVRGSAPAPGTAFVRYGGSTSCLALSVGDDVPALVLDAGSGLDAVTPLLRGKPFDGAVLLTHLHWDHTHGMPFFAGGGATGSRVDVRIPAQGSSVEAVLERCFSPPHFPIVPSQLGPGWSFTAIEEGWYDVEGYAVLAREVPHKGGRTFGYRVERDGASIAYFPDHSPTSLGPGPDGLGERHAAALELARGADLLITDAQHLAAQFPGVGFLGHASVEYDVALALEAEVRALALFHHAPSRTDDELDAIEALAVDLAGPSLQVFAAREGVCLDLSGGRRQHDAQEGDDDVAAVQRLSRAEP